MFVGSWGPAFHEEGDVGRKHFNYPVLITLYGITEMVMGSAHALRVLPFESMPEYSDFRGDTVCLFVLNKTYNPPVEKCSLREHEKGKYVS